MNLIKQIQPNQRYGKYLTTDKWIKRGSSKFVICKCDCGLKKAQSAYGLLRGKVSQCLSCKISSENFKHGQNTQEKITYEYRNWQNLKHEKKLCEKWANDFMVFFRDTGKRPHPDFILLKHHNSNVHSEVNSFWGNRKLRFFKNIQGQKIGDWLILEPALDRPRIFWLCMCSCGRKVHIAQDQLISGKSSKCKSCAAKKHLKTHGYSKNPIYQAYYSMKSRCYDEKNKAFKHYGGRGIKVCDRWLESFEKFVEDMGERPLKHSLDRIDVNGNYEPKNCRWATQQMQCLNQRKTVDMQNEIDDLKAQIEFLKKSK